MAGGGGGRYYSKHSLKYLIYSIKRRGVIKFLAFPMQSSYEGSLYSKAVFVWKSLFLNHRQQLL